MQTPTELLGPEGPLARHITDFAPRPQQQAMAEAVAQAMHNREVLIAEAGTGTGKTYAYLVPALLSGKKIILSTGTKTLQDQLFHRDLPVVRKALSVSVSTALLKGRANYLCLHRLAMTELAGHTLQHEQLAELVSVRGWAGRTQSGDSAELDDIPEDSSIWPLVTSTADNCLGQQCPSYQNCHVMKARRTAQEADLVVINHHLLFADMALREEGFGELLPGANTIILDEAHQLPETASNFFGLTLSSRQLLELARDTRTEQIKEAGDMAALATVADHLEKAVRDFRLALGAGSRRGSWPQLADERDVTLALNTLHEQLESLHNHLEPAAVRGKGLDNCLKRCLELQEKLDRLTHTAPDDHVHWFETYTRAFTLNLTPIDIADNFRSHMQRYPCTWILTSATLTVGNSFDHFVTRMGLHDAVTQRWDSPFDFADLALLYLPQAMPEPSDSAHTTAVVNAALPVIEASDGRTFMLFTSHRALQEAAALLLNKIAFPLLIQGSAPRRELLERFRRLGNAVLLGTNSFWEGVDVRGPALSCVIIDKLPFASPGDPVLQARIEAIRMHGGNPFTDYQLPQAVIALKQGVGRLIRDVSDRGVLMLCDTRLLSKPYGRTFLASLPPMPRTVNLQDVQDFFIEADHARAAQAL
jgi:ATP-dependent DNA helicase DinG